MLTVYKASAGSGKTYALAYEYIKLILGVKDNDTGTYRLNDPKRSPNRHRHILALTFTNKATGEMKRRIVHELAVLAGLEHNWTKPSDYEKDLCAELHCDPAQLKRAATLALNQLLFDFNFFQVSTIDSFFQMVLRTFAREVDLDGSYEVDLDNNRAISQGVSDLFNSLTTNSGSSETRKIVDWIKRFLLDKLADGRKISIFNKQSKLNSDILGFIASLNNDVFTKHYDDMMAYLEDSSKLEQFNKAVDNARRVTFAKIKSDAAGAVAAIEAETAYDKKKKQQVIKVNAALYKALRNLAETGILKKTNTSIPGAFAKLSGSSPTLTGILNKDYIDDHTPHLTDSIFQACKTALETTAVLKLYDNIRHNIFALGLFRSVFAFLGQSNRENNTIQLSDTPALISRLIGDETDAPFIYERIGVMLRHYLIDEFQDTSDAQWNNLKPLVGQGLSESNDSLIIGDVKQCIYRFRFSDPELLNSTVASQFKSKYKPKGHLPAQNTNWRSASDVILFNNDLFAHLASMLNFADKYSNVRQQVSPKHTALPGYISLTGIASPRLDDFAVGSCEIMLREIIRQLRSGYKPKDIVILVRYREQGRKAISYLLEHRDEYPELAGVRITSDDSMTINESSTIRLIISVLRFIAAPDSAIIADLNNRYSRRRDIMMMMNRYEYYIAQNLAPHEAIERAVAETNSAGKEDGVRPDTDPTAQALDAATDLLGFNLPSLVERIIKRFVTPEQADHDNIFISTFVDLVAEYCSRGQADIQSFLQWWDSVGYRSVIPAPDDENAIRTMTIHTSKGLEFDCVHLPFLTDDLVKFKDIEWFETNGEFLTPYYVTPVPADIVPRLLPLKPEEYLRDTQFAKNYADRVSEQQLDELNVLYVAFTRAGRELIATYNLKPAKEEKPSKGKAGKKTDTDDIEGLTAGASATPEPSNHIGTLLSTAINQIASSPASGLIPQPIDDDTDPDTDAPLDADHDEISGGEAPQAEFTIAEHFTRGSATTPVVAAAKPKTAVEPTHTVEMSPYTTDDRADLWEKLKLDPESTYTQAKDRGTSLHEVLARITRPDDLDRALNYCIYRHLVPAEHRDEVRLLLSHLLDSPHARPWFRGFRKVLNERWIISPSAKPEGDHRRPDRIVWTADGHIDVIDYKSGHPDPKKQDDYRLQVAGYMRRLIDMGHTNVRGFLWYLDTNTITPVTLTF